MHPSVATVRSASAVAVSKQRRTSLPGAKRRCYSTVEEFAVAITRGELRGTEAVRSCLLGPGISFGGLAAVSEDEDEDEVHADESTSETPGKSRILTKHRQHLGFL